MGPRDAPGLAAPPRLATGIGVHAVEPGVLKVTEGTEVVLTLKEAGLEAFTAFGPVAND